MLKKISVDKLRPGMHLHELCGAWIDHPFWRTRFTIKDAREIGQIRDAGIVEVWIDAEKGADAQEIPSVDDIQAPLHAPGASPEHITNLLESAPSPPPTAVSHAEELQRAARICADARESVFSMFEEARMGKAIPATAARELVQEISASVVRNPEALISLARLKTADTYTYMHSVAVCALMVALARQLGFDESEVHEAGMGGLLHDLGKARIPLEILNKPGKLTAEEFDLIKKHPGFGHEMLLESSGIGEVALQVVLQHHEKLDGSGYPNGLDGTSTSVYVRMASVCDVYDAITSNRPYKQGWDPATSISKMATWCGGHLDMHVYQAFVKSIGIYPVGSLVRLSSGRLAVVIEQSADSLLKPSVRAFFSTKSHAHIPPEVIRLSRRGATESIVQHEDAARWGFKNLERLIGV
jgi:putative nucleotidyltransferase with HDIG domain